MNLDEFIARWEASGAAERANKDAFLYELCDVLGVARPVPATGERARDRYCFERDVTRVQFDLRGQGRGGAPT
jgi:hypothetical protein